jgi:hypothetical protein
VLKALPDYLGPVATVLAVVLAYYFGRRQTEYQRLYERRAEVIAGLFERYARMDERSQSIIGELFDRTPEQHENENATMVELASESFEELLQYHHANSIWLSRSTSRRLSDFTQRYSKVFSQLQDSTKPIEMGQNWRARIANSLLTTDEFARESLEIRNALEDEFRAALGDRRAKLARLWRSLVDARAGSRPGADGGPTGIRRETEELGHPSSEEEAQEGAQRP